MRFGIFLLVAFFCLGCVPGRGTPVMTIQKFQSAPIGMSEETLVQTYGKPRNIYYRDDGVVLYEYIEQFQTAYSTNTIVEVRRYYFVVKNGKVVSKRMGVKNRPAYEPMDNVNPPFPE